MGIINDADKLELGKLLYTMEEEVRLIVFTKQQCNFCDETKQMCDELAGISKKIVVESYDLQSDPEKAKEYKVEKTPAVVIAGKNTQGIRFYGIPAGYEFTSMVEDIIDVSTGRTALNSETKRLLMNLQEDIHIQVFVTPTCPYCPRAVRMAHMMAVESPRITADMVESTQFPDIAMQYGVMGVPKTVVNGSRSFEGALPEHQFVNKVLGV